MSAILKTGIVILAAGSSSRLGQPKQLLSYQHKSLLARTIEAAKSTRDGIVVVILGEKHAAIAKDVEPSGVRVVYNEGWEEGMSSSIRAGLSALTAHTELDGVILTVCDQPFLTASVLNALLDAAESSGKSIVASAYGDTLGTPVFFSKQHFEDLLALKGAEGARMLIKKYETQVASLPFEKGEVDIDTLEDYQKLIS
ncbi:MAG: nucleotidyltransferase family protein [Pedobacter sp.]|uniref:nucleotidyltransferase family protein n=1 Tax=Pedobacter sp. TaxID=1411316 RepID=UPI00339846DA